MTEPTQGAKRIPAHKDGEKLEMFLHDYYNVALPHGSISTILTTAFRALLGAGVVVLDDGTPATDLQIDVHGGRVMLAQSDKQTGGESDTWWFPHPEGDLPSFDGAITELVELLIKILGEAPWTGEIDHPHTRN
jgi:hypothetical protein